MKEKFSHIYKENVDKIYRFILFKVNSREIAQDLTSETFTRMLEHLNNEMDSDGRVKNAGAFLYMIAKNIVTDYYRQKPKSHVLVDEASSYLLEKESPVFYHADYAAIQKDSSRQIATALSKMDDEFREVLTLHYIEDLSVKEVSEILGRPEGTIRVMLHRGLKELRKHFTN